MKQQHGVIVYLAKLELYGCNIWGLGNTYININIYIQVTYGKAVGFTQVHGFTQSLNNCHEKHSNNKTTMCQIILCSILSKRCSVDL